MMVDLASVVKIWLTVKPIKRLKARRRRKKLETTETELTIMDAGFLKEILKLVIRHGLTAGGFAGVVSGGDIEMLAGSVALIAGIVWSAVRKWLRRKREA